MSPYPNAARRRTRHALAALVVALAAALVLLNGGDASAPVTAIRTGSVDPDPTWTPLLATPRHPEYPSDHAGYAGAAEGVLTWLTGPRAPEPVDATSATAPGSVHTYTRWSQITQETIDGRVWEGVHYRFSDEIAAKVGKQVAAWDLPPLYQLGL